MAKEESLLQYYEQDLAIKDLTQTKDWGWLSFINFYLFQILQMINKVVQNYGWSIIILTVLIRILLLPLMFKVQQSSRIMRILKPKIQNIREIYKDQPEQMNQKILDIYRQHKINPLISIIFILPQIPIMYSIWSLTQDIIFNNQPFILWMDNMYVRDSYVLIDFTSMGIILTLLGLLTSLSMYLGLIHTINQNIQMSMHTKLHY